MIADIIGPQGAKYFPVVMTFAVLILISNLMGTFPLFMSPTAATSVTFALGISSFIYYNYIGISEPADEMFGKIMSISDTLMWRYFDLLSFMDADKITVMKREVEAGANPRDIKFELAKEIVSRFHGGAKAGNDALENFIARFQKGETPQDMPDVELAAVDGSLALPRLLKDAGLTTSTSEAIRLIQQGGVRMDGERVSDAGHSVSCGETHIFQVGKRKFARVRVR